MCVFNYFFSWVKVIDVCTEVIIFVVLSLPFIQELSGICFLTFFLPGQNVIMVFVRELSTLLCVYSHVISTKVMGKVGRGMRPRLARCGKSSRCS